MPRDDQATFRALKEVLAPFASQLRVAADTDKEYTLVTQANSHKGGPMYFGSVRLGKAYVSYHLMPLYYNEPLNAKISSELKKRKQGKTCFNFKNIDKPLFAQLAELTKSGLEDFRKLGYL